MYFKAFSMTYNIKVMTTFPLFNDKQIKHIFTEIYFSLFKHISLKHIEV